MNTKKNKSHAQYVDANPVEAIRSIGTSVGKAVAEDLSTTTINNLWDQLLGTSSAGPRGGDLAMGQEISFSKKQERAPHVEAGIDYRREVIHGSKAEAKETQALEYQIREIQNEIDLIIQQSAEMKVTFREISGQKRVTKAGKYHASFFSFVLAVIRQTRRRVENSATWLKSVKGKGKHGHGSKKQQNSYWNQFEEKGTSFSLSSERNVATQVG